MDGYVQEEETLPQQDSQLNAPITLSQLLTAQDRLNSASCHAKDKIPNAALNNYTSTVAALITCTDECNLASLRIPHHLETRALVPTIERRQRQIKAENW